MPAKTGNDILVAIWVLSTLRWSDRRIAALKDKLPGSHHTIKRYREEAYVLAEAKKLPIFANSEKQLRIISVGSSSDVEYIEGKINHGDCGGGRRARPHKYNDDWMEEGERP